MIETNVRIPVQVTGDMRAQLSACNIAERQFLELVERFGLETTRHYMMAVIEYAGKVSHARDCVSCPMENTHLKIGSMRWN
ncbi:MAG: hypothetical protein CM1200mP41_05280 [Gammaproteobacteria bacterium]|nr:MAG: hypothetical protein CM1200mP41_05280 [Gammaproteobacteria bacterium]